MALPDEQDSIKVGDADFSIEEGIYSIQPPGRLDPFAQWENFVFHSNYFCTCVQYVIYNFVLAIFTTDNLPLMFTFHLQIIHWTVIITVIIIPLLIGIDTAKP